MGFRLWLLFLFTGLALGCDRPSAPAPAAPDKLSIVATTYPLADIARQVAGPLAKCDWIVEQGQSLDALDPTPEALDRTHRADFVITGGQGEEWAVNGFDDPRLAKSVIRLDVLEAAKADLGCRQLWLDPEVAKALAKMMTERLTTRRPDQTQALRKNAASFIRQIDDLLGEFDQGLVAIRGKKVLVLSADYSAFARAFGLTQVQPVTVSPLRLNDDDLRKLKAAVQAQKPKAMLLEVGLPLAVQQDLAQKLNLPIIPIDSLGTSAGDGRNTYLAILRFDLEQIIKLNDSATH